jgi:hypothetical protein
VLHTIATPTADHAGYIELSVMDPVASIGESARRVNRVATLDGGAVVNDFGFSEADRTIDLAWQPTSRAVEDAVVRMLKLYEQIHVSTPAGFFRAAPERYTPGATESRLRLLVLAKLSE